MMTERYRAHLHGAAAWLEESIEHGRGGSSAYYAPLIGWARPYPETTGYLIPTLLELPAAVPTSKAFEDRAIDLGDWLVRIQSPGGSWSGGLHPPKEDRPSVFNTAQIMLGLLSLYRRTRQDEWLAAARRAGEWVVRTAEPGGYWSVGTYVPGFQPSYYTRVAWPLLELDREVGGGTSFATVAHEVLERHAAGLRPDGMIEGWGFQPGAAAFTHTISYTLRGFIEASSTDGSVRYDEVVQSALDILFRKAELSHGWLPGAYREGWEEAMSGSCLTGNCQLAICLLRWHRRHPDLRLVNTAAKLIDRVASTQSLRHPIAGMRGGIAGSHPIWDRYMRWRYPNWASKFFVDGIVELLSVLNREG